MTRENKTVGNRDNHYGNLLVGAKGRRRLNIVTDWLRAEFRHADEVDIGEAVEAVEEIIRGRRGHGTE